MHGCGDSNALEMELLPSSAKPSVDDVTKKVHFSMHLMQFIIFFNEGWLHN